jgi:sialic acid synthase SpsE
MVAHIREVERALGDGRRDGNTAAEREQIARLEMRAIAARPLAAGTPVGEGDVIFRRSSEGLSAWEFAGGAAAADVAAGTPLTAATLRKGER